MHTKPTAKACGSDGIFHYIRRHRCHQERGSGSGCACNWRVSSSTFARNSSIGSVDGTGSGCVGGSASCAERRFVSSSRFRARSWYIAAVSRASVACRSACSARRSARSSCRSSATTASRSGSWCPARFRPVVSSCPVAPSSVVSSGWCCSCPDGT